MKKEYTPKKKLKRQKKRECDAWRVSDFDGTRPISAAWAAEREWDRIQLHTSAMEHFLSLPCSTSLLDPLPTLPHPVPSSTNSPTLVDESARLASVPGH